jgi:hypothetical protein
VVRRLIGGNGALLQMGVLAAGAAAWPAATLAYCGRVRRRVVAAGGAAGDICIISGSLRSIWAADNLLLLQALKDHE